MVEILMDVCRPMSGKLLWTKNDPAVPSYAYVEIRGNLWSFCNPAGHCWLLWFSAVLTPGGDETFQLHHLRGVRVNAKGQLQPLKFQRPLSST